jgi:hypothetical protein
MTTSRRDFVKLGALAASLAVPAARVNAAAAQPLRTPGGTPMRGPIFNQDDTEWFFTHSPQQCTPEAVDAWVDTLADAGVGTLMSCVCAMRANYRSQVWESDWDGYDPAGPDDQPKLRDSGIGNAAVLRSWLDCGRRLADELGINFHQRAFARCRQLGISPWASIRMNDVHDCTLPDSPLLSTFFREQRAAGKLRSPQPQSWQEHALDWLRPEVRDHYMLFVQEQLDILDLDGLELDWMRFGFHFPVGRELEGGRVLTEWIGDVRRRCNAAAARLGHPVRLGVRVPSQPDTARNLGLDGVAWAREGLVDLVVPTPFWETCEFDMPIREWKRLLEGTGAALAGGLEIRYQPFPGGPADMMTPELACGAATAVMAGGSDQVYLFNYFADQHLGGLWSRESFSQTLCAMRTTEELYRMPRRHAVTFRDIVAPGEMRTAALPASGGVCTFRLQTGPRPVDRRVTVLLEVETSGAPPAVWVNSVPCPAPTSPDKGVQVYPVPAEAVAEEAQVVEVRASDEATFTLRRVEVAVSA